MKAAFSSSLLDVHALYKAHLTTECESIEKLRLYH